MKPPTPSLSAHAQSLAAPIHDRGMLSGQTAIVTGSSRGIGRAIVQELARCGANVIINYFEHRDEAYELADALRSLGGGVEVIQTDVSEYDKVARLVESTRERFSGIDILVNNAGITRDRTLRKMSPEEWHRVLQVNLSGVFNCTRAVVPHMIERRRGNIVNIASVIGQTAAFGQSNYSAAKAGVIGFTRSCALELAPYGIPVNAICPGFVDTDMLRAVPDEVRQSILHRIPQGRFASPEEIARCVRFLVTEGTYITGQCININGGIFT